MTLNFIVNPKRKKGQVKRRTKIVRKRKTGSTGRSRVVRTRTKRRPMTALQKKYFAKGHAPVKRTVRRVRRMKRNPAGRFLIQGIAGNAKYFFTGTSFASERQRGIVFTKSEIAQNKAQRLIASREVPPPINGLRVVGA